MILLSSARFRDFLPIDLRQDLQYSLVAIQGIQ